MYSNVSVGFRKVVSLVLMQPAGTTNTKKSAT